MTEVMDDRNTGVEGKHPVLLYPPSGPSVCSLLPLQQSRTVASCRAGSVDFEEIESRCLIDVCLPASLIFKEVKC